jgi:cardiolipin synthase A/B
METLLGILLLVLNVTLAILASAHAVLFKRDVRAALGWVGVIWLVPTVGPLLYAALGINRIRTRARTMRRELVGPEIPALESGESDIVAAAVGEPHLRALRHVVDRLVPDPVVGGNRVVLLRDGDEAYPAMLDAIRVAERSIILTTYIFDNDVSGREFVAALAAAMERGVEVRVLIDGVGARYTFPPVTWVLKRARVRYARFLPPLIPWRFPYFNLRTHRKVMVVDGRVAFTGGMNIRVGHVLGKEPSHPIRDLHARVEGPVVAQLLRVAIIDWRLATREALTGAAWAPHAEATGHLYARAIPDGPDADFDIVRMTYLGALASAQRRVRIISPYFVPETALITALGITAMQGIRVDVVMPAKNNLALVQWAATAQLWQLAERGVHLWLSPGVFDHTKLMVVDDAWTLLGSANWDARSLRLNFELNLECYSRELAQQANELIDERIMDAQEVTLETLDARSLPVRLRDGVARLLALCL